VSSTPDCPECTQGKCGNCDGSSWNPKADDVDACPCAGRDHQPAATPEPIRLTPMSPGYRAIACPESGCRWHTHGQTREAILPRYEEHHRKEHQS
jgi:hypothetical protein